MPPAFNIIRKTKFILYLKKKISLDITDCPLQETEVHDLSWHQRSDTAWPQIPTCHDRCGTNPGSWTPTRARRPHLQIPGRFQPPLKRPKCSSRPFSSLTVLSCPRPTYPCSSRPDVPPPRTPPLPRSSHSPKLSQTGARPKSSISPPSPFPPPLALNPQGDP